MSSRCYVREQYPIVISGSAQRGSVLILIDPIFMQRDINHLVVVVEASNGDELLD